MQVNKKCFYRFISSKAKTWESVGLLPNGAGELVTKDTEKVLDALFISVFTGKTGLQKS